MRPCSHWLPAPYSPILWLKDSKLWGLVKKNNQILWLISQRNHAFRAIVDHTSIRRCKSLSPKVKATTQRNNTPPKEFGPLSVILTRPISPTAISSVTPWYGGFCCIIVAVTQNFVSAHFPY